MELLSLNTILEPQGIFHLCSFLLLSQELLRNHAPVSPLLWQPQWLSEQWDWCMSSAP